MRVRGGQGFEGCFGDVVDVGREQEGGIKDNSKVVALDLEGDMMCNKSSTAGTEPVLKSKVCFSQT